VLVDHRDSVGRTALHYAAGYGQADAVRALVRHGASVDAPDRFGVTPLHWACLKAQASVVEALLAAHADTLLTACAGVFSGKSALDLASAESHSAEVSEALTSALGAAAAEVTDLVATTTSTDELSSTSADLGSVRYASIARADAPTYALGGVPVGTTQWTSAAKGYAQVSGQCAAAFPSTDRSPPAHLCSRQEVLMSAMTAADRFTPAMDGAVFATFDAKGVPLPDINGDTFFNDCAAFLSETAFIAQEYRAFASAVRVVDGKVFAEYSVCSPGLSNLLCCQ
jgi:ankyrin repeat protein